MRQAYDQNKATLGENDAATQRYASQVNKAVADLNRFENELKQVNRQAEQKGMDKLNNALKALQAEFQSITTGMGGFSHATEQTQAKVDLLSRIVDKQKRRLGNFNKPIIVQKQKKVEQANPHSDMPSKFIGQQLN